MIFSTGSSVYGQRLNGLVKISGDVTKGIKDEILELEEVSNIDIRVQGKIVYTTITFKEGTKLNRAKEVASSTISKYDEGVISYYDFGYFLIEEIVKNEDNGENAEEKKGFVVAGTKHPDIEKISWIKS